MTDFDLLRLIGQADDKYILESRRRPKKVPVLRRYLPQVLAACLILCVLGSTVTAGLIFGRNTASGAADETAAAGSAAAGEPADVAAPAEAPAEPEAGAPAGEADGAPGGSQPLSAYDVSLLASAQYPQTFATNSGEAESQQWDDNPVSDETYAALYAFSFATAAQVLPGETNSGCFSPLSLYQSLAILADGAQGQTQAELLSLLGMPDRDTLAEQSGLLYRRNYLDNDVNRLIISNGLWLDETASDGTAVSYSRDWVMNAATNYYADVYQAEFSDPDTAGAMGAWISEKTGGFLHPTLSVSPDTLLSVVNTVWYKACWASLFEPEENTRGDFTTASGEKVQAEYMHQSAAMTGWRHSEEFDMAALSMSNGCAYFALPREGVDVDSLLTEEKLWEVFGDFRFRSDYDGAQVTWSIPKFETTATYRLRDALSALDVTSVFGPQADLSGISDSPLYVDNIQQGTRISINEEGVEAASFTATDFLTYDPAELPQVEMNLNRPFIYLITARDGSPLFLGVVRDLGK